MGTLILVVLTTAFILSLTWLRPRWATRNIFVPWFVIVGAAVVAALTTASVGVVVNSWVGASTGVFAGIATLTCYTDLKSHLVPSGAIWAGVAGGGVVLGGGVALGVIPLMAVFSVVALLVVVALMAGVAVVTGGFGGGDVRFLVLIAFTLWWLPLPVVLVGILVGHIAGFIHVLITKSGVPFLPYLTGGVSLVALCVFLFMR